MTNNHQVVSSIREVMTREVIARRPNDEFEGVANRDSKLFKSRETRHQEGGRGKFTNNQFNEVVADAT
jgi:hypothetical protein